MQIGCEWRPISVRSASENEWEIGGDVGPTTTEQIAVGARAARL
jgi:hypothetical protein